MTQTPNLSIERRENRQPRGVLSSRAVSVRRDRSESLSCFALGERAPSRKTRIRSSSRLKFKQAASFAGHDEECIQLETAALLLMKIALAVAVLATSSAGQAAPPCEIKGPAMHWAYDACMGRYETDDSLHPGVMACADRAQRLIRAKGGCKAKRIFKEQMCLLLQLPADRRSSQQACMQDPGVVGSTVKNGGL